eukprot:6856619-Heterocapsa_arctica.AAC.1
MLQHSSIIGLAVTLTRVLLIGRLRSVNGRSSYPPIEPGSTLAWLATGRQRPQSDYGWQN